MQQDLIKYNRSGGRLRRREENMRTDIETINDVLRRLEESSVSQVQIADAELRKAKITEGTESFTVDLKRNALSYHKGYHDAIVSMHNIIELIFGEVEA